MFLPAMLLSYLGAFVALLSPTRIFTSPPSVRPPGKADDAAQALLERAADYEASQPSYAADLRAAALPLSRAR